MKKLNRALVRDVLGDFIREKGVTSSDAYLSGAEDFAQYLQEQFPEEKNIHLSKEGEEQYLYRFHFKVGPMPTSKQKWMSPEKARAYAEQNGYELELIRTTHKPV